MKDLYQKEVKEIVLNEIDKLYEEIPWKKSLIEPSEFMEHLIKRKAQLDYIMDHFEQYVDFVSEHLSEQYDFYSESNIRIPIQMVAIDITLGKRISTALLEYHIDNNDQKSYFEAQAKQIEWILSRVDIDRTFESFKNMNQIYLRQTVKI